jgi:hypothetical protein
MHPAIRQRWTTLQEISNCPWVRVLLAIWTLSGIWDLALSEWVPEQYAKQLPKIYQVIAMSAGLASWQVWLLVGAVLVVAGAIEYAFRHKRRFSQLSQQVTSSTTRTAQVKEGINRPEYSTYRGTTRINLFAECDIAPPILVPADGKIHMLNIQAIGSEVGGGGFGTFTGSPGAKFEWPTKLVRRLRLTNYSDEPLFKVSLTLHFRFMEALKDPNDAMRSGAVTIDRDWKIEIPKIDTGKDATFVLYLFNMSAQFVEVTLPRDVIALVATSQEIGSIGLVQPTDTVMRFAPNPEMIR